MSGGFWGIEGDDGQKYQPTTPLPPEFQQEGLKVKAEVSPAYAFTIFMWGKSVEVGKIEKL
ncbi:MAG: hypothetical protein D6730_10295 [Bacteroidetes bacterium]|nr:MAG: hypothetical protein D6730_10295 [Bacteroidota bacterium]